MLFFIYYYSPQTYVFLFLICSMFTGVLQLTLKSMEMSTSKNVTSDFPGKLSFRYTFIKNEILYQKSERCEGLPLLLCISLTLKQSWCKNFIFLNLSRRFSNISGLRRNVQNFSVRLLHIIKGLNLFSEC